MGNEILNGIDMISGETADEYRLYTMYRTQRKPRSIAVLAVEANYATPQPIARIAEKNRWKERLEIFAADQAREIIEAEREATLHARSRRRTILEGFTAKVAKQLTEYQPIPNVPLRQLTEAIVALHDLSVAEYEGGIVNSGHDGGMSQVITMYTKNKNGVFVSPDDWDEPNETTQIQRQLSDTTQR